MTDAAYNTYLYNYSNKLNSKVQMALTYRDSFRGLCKKEKDGGNFSVHFIKEKFCDSPELVKIKSKIVNRNPNHIITIIKKCFPCNQSILKFKK